MHRVSLLLSTSAMAWTPETAVLTRSSAGSGAASHQQVLVVSDFDLTLTAGGSAQCHDVLGDHPALPELHEDFSELLDFSKPHPAELAGDGWWVRANEIIVKSRIRLRGLLPRLVRERTRSHGSMEPRPGGVELLRRCAELRVPVLVVSAGFCDVIEHWLSVHGGMPPEDADDECLVRVSSNRLRFADDDDRVRAVTPTPPVTSMTKDRTYERNAAWFEAHASRRTLLVLGDRVSDLDVLKGVPPSRFDRIVRVGVRNDVPEWDQPKEVDDFRAAFDVVVVGDRGSLEPVATLLDDLDSYSCTR